MTEKQPFYRFVRQRQKKTNSKNKKNAQICFLQIFCFDFYLKQDTEKITTRDPEVKVRMSM